MKFTSVLLSLLVLAFAAFAQPQQSEDFRITKSVIDAGGAPGTSTDFGLISAFGQPSPLGVQSSADFLLYPGFLAPTFAVSPLSPVQELVIQAMPPNMRLSWPRVPGASYYKIYRSSDPLFAPGPSTLIDSVSDSTFTDAAALALTPVKHYYVVTAATALGTLIQPDPTRNMPNSRAAIVNPDRKQAPPTKAIKMKK
jgi:hypothetical protein